MGSNLIDLLDKILTILVPVAICLINNKYQKDAKSEALMKSIQDTYTKQTNAIKDDYTKQIANMKSDSEARHDSLQQSMNNLITEFKLALQDVTNKIDRLEEKQEKYNHLQERTLELEADNKVQNEKISHLEKAVGGI